MNKVLMISAALPPRVCGIGDYTFNILQTDAAKGWFTISHKKWGFNTLINVIYKIKRLNPDIVFMQYPGEGYGWSLVPHFISLLSKFILGKPTIIVLHEYSSFNPKGKFFINHLFSKCSALIFTNEYENSLFCSNNKSKKIKTFVIPILSNISKPTAIKSVSEREYDLLYFGHLRPNKGLETFVSVVNQLRLSNPSIKVLIVGQVPLGYEKFVDDLLSPYKNGSNFNLIKNATEEEVINSLSNTKIAFLPFPDGVSERRGSYYASIQCGCVVASYIGPFTLDQQLGTFIQIVRGSESHELSIALSCQSKLTTFQSKALLYNNTRPVHTWEDVAYLYLQTAIEISQ